MFSAYHEQSYDSKFSLICLVLTGLYLDPSLLWITFDVPLKQTLMQSWRFRIHQKSPATSFSLCSCLPLLQLSSGPFTNSHPDYTSSTFPVELAMPQKTTSSLPPFVYSADIYRRLTMCQGYTQSGKITMNKIQPLLATHHSHKTSSLVSPTSTRSCIPSLAWVPSLQYFYNFKSDCHDDVCS